MNWSFLTTKNMLTLVPVLVLIFGVLLTINYAIKLENVKKDLEVEKQINKNTQQRNQIDENVFNKSDYDICIANGGLHDNCK